MPDRPENLQCKADERDYAMTLQELEQGLPIFGRITGTTDDLEQFDKELPYNFRQPFNVVKAIFKLQPGLYTLHTGTDQDTTIGFRIDRPAGELGETGQQAYPEKKLDTPGDYHQHRALRLEGELHDADRKIRQLVDEIMGLKRQLSEDKTATLLTHQKELSELKESHRNEIDRLKELHRGDLKDLEKQLGELEKVKFRMEMEHRAGGRDAGSRMLDMLEENAPMFFTVISQLFGSQGPKNQFGQVMGPNQPGNNTDISEEQAKVLAESLKNQMQSTDPSLSQPHALPKDEANQHKGAGDQTPRHLPADNSEPTGNGEEGTINGIFSPPQVNGHSEPTISL